MSDNNFCPHCGKRMQDIHTCTPPGTLWGASQAATSGYYADQKLKTEEMRRSMGRRAKIAADPQAFYGFPEGPVSSPNAGGKCVTAGETALTHTINTNHAVAVATDTYWLPIDKDTPRSVKLQLLSIGGVAQYGTLGSDVSFYTHWSPLPKRRKE